MAFYVPIGPRGLLFRAGSLIIQITGTMTYKRAYRRRIALLRQKVPSPALAQSPIALTPAPIRSGLGAG